MFKSVLQAKKFAALKPFRLPFHPPFMRGVRSLIEQEPSSVAQQALAILRSYSTDAHVYLPGGDGVSLSGLLTNNYTESTFVTYSSTDGVAGGVRDAIGAIDATQTTTANKPAIHRGLFNLLTDSGDLTSPAWGKVGTPTVTATSFTRISTGPTFVNNAVSKTATSLPYTQAGVFSAGTGRYVALRMQGTYPARVDAVFDLQTGTVSSAASVVAGFTSGVASIASLGGGTYVCAVSATTDAVTSLAHIFSFNSNGVVVDGTDSSATSSGTSSTSGLFQGTLTAAQILAEGGIPLATSVAASNPNAGRYWWGVDGPDSLVLGGQPFEYTDDWFVCIGGSCSNKTSYPGLLELGGTTARVYVYFDASGIVVTQLRDDAAADTYIVGPAFAEGAPGVLSSYKQSGIVCTGLNGVYGTPAAAPAGTYTLTSAKLVNSLVGMCGAAVIVKGALTAAERLTLERFVASLTPAAPSF